MSCGLVESINGTALCGWEMKLSSVSCGCCCSNTCIVSIRYFVDIRSIAFDINILHRFIKFPNFSVFSNETFFFGKIIWILDDFPKFGMSLPINSTIFFWPNHANKLLDPIIADFVGFHDSCSQYDEILSDLHWARHKFTSRSVECTRYVDEKRESKIDKIEGQRY